MRYTLLIILFLSCLSAFAQPMKFIATYKKKTAAATFPQVVGRFNLSWTTSTVADWVSVIGNPNTNLLTASDTRTGNSVTISTIAIGDANWMGNGTAAAGYVVQSTANGTHPAELGSGYFFNMQDSVPLVGNIQVGGLVPGATYSFALWSNRPQVTDNRRTTIACIDASTTQWCVVNSAPSTNSTTPITAGFTGTVNQVTGAGTVVTFINKIANGGGFVNFAVSGSLGYTFGYVNDVEVTRTL